jgi:hypothetical protein
MEAELPFFWTLGFAGAAVVFLSAYLFATGGFARSPAQAAAARYGIRVVSAWPCALLAAPFLPVGSLSAYLTGIVVVCVVLGLLPSADLILFATAAVIAVDALNGGHMVAQSLLSDYWLSGIRFYGIGNEYMGILIAGSLLLIRLLGLRPSEGEAKEGGAPWRRIVLGLWFAAATVALSCPAFGAKAGGAITAVATFVFAGRLLAGKRIGAGTVIAGGLGGLALVAFWALVDRIAAPGSPTHIDTAFHALAGGRLGYIVGIAARKVGLAARVLFHPGTLLGLLGFVLLAGVALGLLRESIRGYLDVMPSRRVIIGAGLRGAVVALLVNDSGAVAAILMLMTMVLPPVHDMIGQALCESQPSTSVKSVWA